MSAITVDVLGGTPGRVARGRGPRPGAHGAAAAAGSAQLRLTPLGRAVVVTLSLVLGLGGVLGSQAANAGSPAAAVPVVTRTVAAGETLWAVATEVAGPGEDVRDVVAELMELNGLTEAQLYAGQQILLPAER